MNTQTSELKVVYQATNSIKPAKRNPRAHSENQMERLIRSIQQYGLCMPLLLDAKGHLIAGHAIWQACQKLGFEQVPTIGLAHLTPGQASALQIALNRIAELSSWDDQALALNLQECKDLIVDFDPLSIGFEVPELNCRIDSLDTTPTENTEVLAQLDPSAIAVTRQGDLYQCGSHRVYCGNALLNSSFVTLMENAKADLVIVDPPYGCPIVGHVITRKTQSKSHANASTATNAKPHPTHREFIMGSNLSQPELYEFIRGYSVNLINHTRDGSLHFHFMDWRGSGTMSLALEQYTELKNILVWSKGCGSMGSQYRSAYELIYLCKNGSAQHTNNIQLGKHGRYRTNVLNYPGVKSFSRDLQGKRLLDMHPTCKPVALLKDLIYDCSARGDLVIDCFLGSGSTLIACEQSARICYGMELDPLYVDTAIRRWQQQSGKKAIHIQSGLSFDEREAQLANTALEHNHA